MFADDDFMAAHFPPRLVFHDRDDLAHHKSRLILEGRLLSETQAHELAVLLFQQAGDIEVRLAATATADADAPNRSDHLVSAASCFARSGDLQSAISIVRELSLDEEATAYFAKAAKALESSRPLYSQLLDAFRERSLDRLHHIADTAWGLLPVRILCWPLTRLASNNSLTDAARRALQRMIVAYPTELPLHVIYLSSYWARSNLDAIVYARELVSAFPDQLAAHVSLASVLVHTQRHEEAAIVAQGMLELTRQDPSRSGDLNSMISMAFATASIALRRSNRADIAREILAEGVRRLPSDPELRTLYAIALAGSGDPAAAATETEHAIKQIEHEEPEVARTRSHWAHTIDGLLALRQGALEHAIHSLTIAANRSAGRSRARILNDLAVACVRHGEATRAESLFRSALEVDDTLAIARRNLERLRLEARQAQELATDDSSMEDDLFGRLASTYGNAVAHASQQLHAA